MNILHLFLFIIGFLVLAFIFMVMGGAIILKQDHCGNLIINDTDPEKDIFRFEFTDLDKIYGKEYLVFKAIHESKK